MNFDILSVLRWPELTSGRPFPVWQMQLPLPPNWEMIRCAWGDVCRTWSGPQTYNGSAFTLSNEYIRWILIFWPSSDDQNSPQSNPFQFDKCISPFPKIGKWSDVLEATSVGHDLDLRCWYRFSWKAISTYMSSTLARLCGEWRLFGDLARIARDLLVRTTKLEAENTKLWKRLFVFQPQIFRIPTGDYFITEYRDFKREKQSSDSDLSYICRRR